MIEIKELANRLELELKRVNDLFMIYYSNYYKDSKHTDSLYHEHKEKYIASISKIELLLELMKRQ
jgi:hypothetical protein